MLRWIEKLGQRHAATIAANIASERKFWHGRSH
jgi:hypothetical protein